MHSVSVTTLTGQTKTFTLPNDLHVASLRQKVALWQCVTPDCVTLLWCGSCLKDTCKLTSVSLSSCVHAVVEPWPATYDRLTKDIDAAKASCVCKQRSDIARLQDTVANLNFRASRVSKRATGHQLEKLKFDLKELYLMSNLAKYHYCYFLTKHELAKHYSDAANTAATTLLS